MVIEQNYKAYIIKLLNEYKLYTYLKKALNICILNDHNPTCINLLISQVRTSISTMEKSYCFGVSDMETI